MALDHGRLRTAVRAVLSCAMAVFGLLVLAIGGSAINAPSSGGGPMHTDLSPVIGSAFLVVGLAVMASLRRSWSRIAWVAAIPVTLATTGRHFYAYPPFADGAYLQLRYSVSDGPFPADPVPTMLGFTIIAVAVDLVLWPGPPGWKASCRRGLLTVAMTAISCTVYTWFVDAVDNGSSWEILPVFAAVSCVVFARSKGAAIRTILSHASVLLMVCVATLVLFNLPM